MSIDESILAPREIDFTVEFRGKKLKFKARELTAWEYNKIQDRAIKKILPDGSVDIDRVKYMFELVSASLVEAPFDTDVETLKKLPESLFNAILMRVLELNPLSS